MITDANHGKVSHGIVEFGIHKKFSLLHKKLVQLIFDKNTLPHTTISLKTSISILITTLH